MDAGLDLVASSISVTGLTAAADYTVSTSAADACDFEIAFTESYLNSLIADTDIVVTYEATLNGEATVAGIDNNNKQQQQDASGLWRCPDRRGGGGRVYLFLRPDQNRPGERHSRQRLPVLTGAKFKLYDAETGGNEIKLVQVTDAVDGGYYRPAVTGETGVEIEAGEVTIKGLGNGTYYLEETEAPISYNRLTGRQAVTIDGASLTNTAAADNTYTAKDTDTGIQVVNQAGTELPSTGGIGTTIFYVLGGILIVGAVVLLVSRKRMRERMIAEHT